MTTVQFILIIIAVVIMVVGLYMIIRGIVKQKKSANSQGIIRDKNGIPIIPRHERKLVEDADEHLESGETIIIPDRKHLQPVIHDKLHEDTSVYHNANYSASHNASHNANYNAGYNASSDSEDRGDYDEPDFSETSYSSMSQDLESHPVDTGLNTQSATADQVHTYQSDTYQKYTSSTVAKPVDSNLSAFHSHSIQEEDAEDDLFSNLVSATEKLMPVIQTAEEPEFIDNSPMLDQHLLAEADQDQNSPLNHAQENINITLVPREDYGTIDGKKILSLVSQYGLKYGAMNMFHRYEHKDGSGILWFSMMGVTDEGIAPFDLNMLPSSQYNGLVFFLSLPHPKATQGFDSMMSVVNLISNDLNMTVYDENNEILTRERRQQLRAQVQEYQATF